MKAALARASKAGFVWAEGDVAEGRIGTWMEGDEGDDRVVGLSEMVMKLKQQQASIQVRFRDRGDVDVSDLFHRSGRYRGSSSGHV